MRWQRPNWPRLAAWLGVIALGLNTLVPIHLVFDLADALAPAHHTAAETVDLDRQILAFLCGHEADGHHHHRHGKQPSQQSCPVCAAVATLAALALPTVAALPVPQAIAVRLAAHPAVASPPAILAAAYRSRAPPTA